MKISGKGGVVQRNTEHFNFCVCHWDNELSGIIMQLEDEQRAALSYRGACVSPTFLRIFLDIFR